MTDVENPPNGWEQHAAALADTIAGALPGVDQAWIDAVTHVPRHLLVPLFHQQHHGEWATVGAGDDGFLTEVYRDAPLITALLPNGVGGYEVVSSSTKPALMVRMLDALSIHPGHRVLEIGTGTGYNAALLCHRLGQHAVSSVDIGADLVELARDRLARIGYRPDLCVTDGRAGRPDCGPYDRIIATCSVPAIPWDWYEQLVEDGAVLVDLKIGLHAGNLVLLRRRGDRLEGSFLPKWAGFMTARATDSAPVRPQHRRGPIQHESSTRIDPDPWAGLVPWFLAQIGQPAITGLSRTGPHLATTRFTAADGTWCEIDPADDAGERPVREGGRRRLWSTVQAAHRRWTSLGEPGWERLGITVWPNGQHDLWLDTPTTQLPAVMDGTDRRHGSVAPWILGARP